MNTIDSLYFKSLKENWIKQGAVTPHPDCTCNNILASSCPLKATIAHNSPFYISKCKNNKLYMLSANNFIKPELLKFKYKQIQKCIFDYKTLNFKKCNSKTETKEVKKLSLFSKLKEFFNVKA